MGARALACALACVLFASACEREAPAPLQTVVNPLLADQRVRWDDGALEVVNARCESQAFDDTTRQRIVNLAVSQWRRFGYGVVDRSGQWPDATPAVLRDQLIAEYPLLAGIPDAERGTFLESDQGARAAIGGYWSIVDPAPHANGAPLEGSRIAEQNRTWQRSPGTSWREAWSAVFISWIMCEAGADQGEFLRSSAHSDYMAAAEDGGLFGRAWYRTLPIDVPQVIEPGDLVCARRGASAPPDPRELGFAGHCDVVVSVRGGEMLAIGGNVRDAVMLSILSVSAGPDGKLTLAPNAGTHTPMAWAAVMRLQCCVGTATFEAAFAPRT